jgi:hypothetical protein
MSRRSTFARAGLMTLALGLLGTSTACDLLEFARNPAVSFQLPEQKFTITNQEWKQPPPTFAMAIACAKDTDCCAVPGAPAGTPVPFDCKDLICDAGTCAMTFALELPKLVDLSKDAPTLAAMKGKVVADIVLQSMEYTVNNQLTVALPPLSIYMAPMAVRSVASNPGAAKHLTTLPAVPASTMRTANAPLNEEGQKAFSSFAKDFQTPFNFIATAVFVMRSGAPVPAQSRIDVSFTGTVTAKF